MWVETRRSGWEDIFIKRTSNLSESLLPPLGLILKWTLLSYSCRRKISFWGTRIWVIYLDSSDFDLHVPKDPEMKARLRVVFQPLAPSIIQINRNNEAYLTRRSQKHFHCHSFPQGGLFFYISSPSHGWCIWAYLHAEVIPQRIVGNGIGWEREMNASIALFTLV